MKLHFFDRLRLKIKFLRFANYNYRLHFPVKIETFKRWIILLPLKEDKVVELIPFIYKTRKIYAPQILILVPEKILFMFRSFENAIPYELVDYKILESLNSDILREKTMLIDFLEEDILKSYIIKKCLWVSTDNYGNFIIKGGINELYRFLGLELNQKTDYFKIMGIRRRRTKKYVLVDEKKGYFGSYSPVIPAELNIEDMGFIKEIVCSGNNKLLIKLGEAFNIPVKLRDEEN